jgi:hypothetical protein
MKATEQPTPVIDEVIAEVHRHKRAIMAEHDDDVESVLRNLQERQKENARLVTSTLPANTDKPS